MVSNYRRSKRSVGYSCLVLLVHVLVLAPQKNVQGFLRPPPTFHQNQRVGTGLDAHSQSITHYRRTYHNFRLGKSQGAKGETDQFHVEPDMPAMDEGLLEEETFFSIAGPMTKVSKATFIPVFIS
ncbi:unnamed protein product [Laminaria digitata]